MELGKLSLVDEHNSNIKNYSQKKIKQLVSLLVN